MYMNISKQLGLGVLLLMVLPLFGGGVQAQALKVGYVNPDAIIANMAEYQTIQDQLEQEVQAGQVEIQALMEGFQEKVDRYQKQQPLLPEESRTRREQELAQLQQEIQMAAAQKDQDLSNRQAELLQPLFDKIQQAIDAEAKAQSVTMVVRQDALVYIDESLVVNLNLPVAKRLGIEIDETEVSTANSTDGGSN
jgi:outer membrane protein